MGNDATFRWQVKVEGHSFDLEDVVAVLQPMGYVLQQHDDKEWYLSGPPLDNESTAADALGRTNEMLRNLNAVLLVNNPKFRPVTVGSTVREGESVHAFIQAKPGILRIKTHAALIDKGNATETPPPAFERERRWLVAAQRDSEVQALLNLFGSDADNKYWRAYELIKHDCDRDSEKVRELVGWSKPIFKRVIETLNAPRHEKPNRPPKMSCGEAETRAREMIRVWLDSKP